MTNNIEEALDLPQLLNDLIAYAEKHPMNAEIQRLAIRAKQALERDVFPIYDMDAHKPEDLGEKE